MTPPPPDAHAVPADPLVGTHPPERLRLIDRVRWAALGCTVGLIVLGLAWELWLAPLPGGSGALALKVLPLTAALGGLARHRLYTYRWLSLLVWLYFTEGVVRGSGDQGLSQVLGLVETALSVALFALCGWYVRLRLKVLPGRRNDGGDGVLASPATPAGDQGGRRDARP